ncbi:tyrosine-type recombinase/integrase [Jannaschia seohaensis]|uniref:Site-specific recombinase XerD n=1 Tax=Jannaschia seohaensis TaxID=475081 RepID=A0A2Y9C7L6_9RHOB|nr:tyrosine-type recombinase/integrase [Jannaschia seohaensis]PWJ19361.1 site-specific recombinase XerD [Jannaschia seohaensis]SSA46023.1 Site-specific recombinase XerD [Jannaschia seohaensis]
MKPAARPLEKNERVKRQFMAFRKHAKQLSEKTLDRELAALETFDVWNGRKDFARFHVEWAIGFRGHLDQARGRDGRPFSKSTTRAIMGTLREFILWLSQQDGFRRRIRPADADYFRLSRRDEAEARAAPERPAPSPTQARRALSLMPAGTPREMRDKAVVALLILTGIRVKALVSLRLKHVDLVEKSVMQNPREVATKFGKRIDTFFAKGFDEAEVALAAWMAHLDQTALYGPDDPLFPATAIAPRANSGFAASGFERRPWKSTEPVRQIVRAAFEAAGLPNYGPHAFRHMLARHAAKTAKSVAELVATSQNLGHTDVLTTLRSYGQISRERQRALITGQAEDDLLE